jgi:hypothetical protein
MSDNIPQMENSINLIDLEKRLEQLDSERAQLIVQINSLRQAQEVERKNNSPPFLGRPVSDRVPRTPSEKVDLFLSLFRCREDVYPKRWENSKNGKQGYSPACDLEWVKPLCQKPSIKCSDCSHQKFPQLNESAAELHLKGIQTIGTYAINGDDTCNFLACDFDENSWKEDVLTYKEAARELGVDVSIERSRSGNGGHAWIFFEEFIHARTARSLGTLILAKCSEVNVRLSLDSYDRFFPSQDYLPKGGFGNLIALPLQKTSRDSGNCCFIDNSLNVYDDQWAYLSQVRRLSKQELHSILDSHLPKIKVENREGSFDDISWSCDQAILDKTTMDKIDYYLEDKNIEITFGSMLSIPLSGLHGRIVAKLRKIASFANPEFYKLQRMRMQTYPHQRFIFSGEIRKNEILLPRGVIDEAVKILTLAGGNVVIRDERIGKRKIKVKFNGELSNVQDKAIKVWKAQDTGILMAPPGA